jgi:5-formyltetrahydrofolate cyclo-ligase
MHRDEYPHMHPLNSDEKARVRRDILLRRECIPPDTRKGKDAAIETRLLALPQFVMAKSFLLYASFSSEVSTRHVIAHCLSRGLITVLPRVSDKDDRIHLFQILALEDLAPGYRGIFEPYAVSEREIILEDIDIVITPGVAFDESCSRLGHGKGYYDKLFGSPERKKRTAAAGLKPFFAALAYEEQVVPSIYCGPYDIKMDAVITDKRTIYRHGS